MADEAMQENGTAPTSPHYSLAVEQAEQRERMASFRRWQAEFEVEVRGGFRQINDSISSLKDSLSDRNKTQWPVLIGALGLTFTVLVYFMTQAIGPVRDDQTELKQAISTLAAETNKTIQNLAATTISRQEMDWRSARGTEDRQRTDTAIVDLRATTVTRNEWMERNQSRDHDIENIRTSQTREIANLQRQIDQQRSDFQTFANSLGNGRDFILDLKTEVARLRDQLAEIRARQFQRMGAPPS